MEANTDHGSVLGADECAMFTMNGMTEIGLMLPDAGRLPGGIVPDMMLFVTACAIRAMKDPTFIAEQLEWMASQKPN